MTDPHEQRHYAAVLSVNDPATGDVGEPIHVAVRVETNDDDDVGLVLVMPRAVWRISFLAPVAAGLADRIEREITRLAPPEGWDLS